MRPIGRINKVLSKIRRVWKKYPDLRLMQLLLNCFPDYSRRDGDPYAVEDDELLQLIDETYPRGETDIISGFEPEVGGSNPSEGANSFEVLRDLLLLVGYDVPLDIIKTWEPEVRELVECWAAAHHLACSDNIIEVPTRPDRLDGYEDDGDHLDWLNETPP